MKAVSQLPDGYTAYFAIDLQKNTKLSLLVNGFALLIAALAVIPMLFVVPISTLFNMSGGLGHYFLKFAVLFGLMVAYLVLHELVHGVAMRMCGTKKIKYGFTGLYAFAGSDDYYDKRSYLFIALAPVVLWGIVLAVVTPFVSEQWFWVVYFQQVMNLSGAAGDLYVTVKFFRLPDSVLIKDSGVGMTVYAKSGF